MIVSASAQNVSLICPNQFLDTDYSIGSGHDCQCKCSKCVSHMPQPSFGQNCHIEYGLKFYSSLCMNFPTASTMGLILA